MGLNCKKMSYSKKLFLGILAAMIFLAVMMSSREKKKLVFEDSDRSKIRGLEKLGKEFSIEVSPPENSEEKPTERVGRSVSTSLRWLSDSIETFSEKLKKLSDKLENAPNQTIAEAEIKRAFREALAGEDGSVGTAEVTVDAKEFEKLETQNRSVVRGIDLPVLGEDVPAWVRQRVIEEDRILVPIESSMHATLEECRSELASRLPEEVRKVIDQHVLQHVSADALPGLTSEYISDKLVDHSVEFDNYQERPSGNFHQLWVMLDIDEKAMEQMREWERESTTVVRVWMLSGLTLAFLGSFAGLSGVFKFLSTRERNRHRGQQTA
jgi:hypothetical protein